MLIHRLRQRVTFSPHPCIIGCAALRAEGLAGSGSRFSW
jgi:hypothetical protein